MPQIAGSVSAILFRCASNWMHYYTADQIPPLCSSTLRLCRSCYFSSTCFQAPRCDWVSPRPSLFPPGQLVVLGTLLDRGAQQSNPALQYSLALAPKEPKEPIALAEPRSILALHPLHLLPVKVGKPPPRYVHYRGSLTTPPCSEEVEWIVFDDVIKVAD